ncbi:MAG: ABC transporter substrate-binding protein [Magnetococcales bacterium]|nr:ABC transporter substrate-binding protein [Magnetococcales bacterium]
MSGGSARSGQAIQRGIELAMDEINQSGGVLGRPLRLMVKDHRGNPRRGIDNLNDFAALSNLAAVVGGLHTPVVLQELKTIHAHKLLFLSPWAAGTPVVDNGYDPNYVFRVSVRDQYAGGFLVDKALALGFKQPGLLLEKTGWGRSNLKSMGAALQMHGMKPKGVEWFHWGTKRVGKLIDSLYEQGVDVLFLVANAPEGLAVVRAMAARPKAKRLPIISHWGITGGVFGQRAGKALQQVDLRVLQTFSFLRPPRPQVAAKLLNAYLKKYPNTGEAKEIFAPAGTAHAYDLVHLLKLAIEKAGSLDRPGLQKAMEHLPRYAGLMRIYERPFRPDHHDALNQESFMLARFDAEGRIVPLGEAR